tara:strand:+ start:1089 stop:1262 length:174 start_codon:yes stop_codon:yes gene_type:complete
MKDCENEDTFSIGTPATGGNFKIYIDILDSTETIKKLDAVISLWKKTRMITLEELKR